MKIAVLGIGNILLGDDGVGVHAVKALKEGFDFSENLEFIDGGTMGLDLLPFIEGRDKVLIVDAANFRQEAGTIKTIEGGDMPSFLNTKFSVHQIGLPDMIFAAELIGIKPPQMCLIGIQPGDVSTGLEMSQEIKARFDDLISAVNSKLNEWGVEIKKKENVPCSAL